MGGHMRLCGSAGRWLRKSYALSSKNISEILRRSTDPPKAPAHPGRETRTEPAMLARVMNSVIVGQRSWDPAVFGGVAAGLMLVAVLASYVPSLRATRVDPVEVLRGG